MEGTIQELSVSDLLQIFMSSSKTGTLKLKHAGQQGAIYIKNGEAIHAQYDELSGAEALQDMVMWTDGSFYFVSKLDSPRVTIAKNMTSNILINTNKIQDDLKGAIGQYKNISLDSLVYAAGTIPDGLPEELTIILNKANVLTSIANILKLTGGATEPLIELFRRGLLYIVDQDVTHHYNYFLTECNNDLEMVSAKLSLSFIGEFQDNLNRDIQAHNIPLKVSNFRIYWDTSSIDRELLIRSFHSYYMLFLDNLVKFEKLASFYGDFQKKIELFK